MAVLILLTLGVLAEKLSPSGSTLHVLGIIDVTAAIIVMVLCVLAMFRSD